MPIDEELGKNSLGDHIADAIRKLQPRPAAVSLCTCSVSEVKRREEEFNLFQKKIALPMYVHLLEDRDTRWFASAESFELSGSWAWFVARVRSWKPWKEERREILVTRLQTHMRLADLLEK